MRGFRRLTRVVIAFTFILIVLGAVARVGGAGLACPDWPQCYHLWPPAADSLAGVGDGDDGVLMLEWGHRLIAGIIVGPLVIWLTLWAFGLRRDSHAVAPLMIFAVALVALQVALDATAVIAGDSALAVAVNLVMTLLFFATLLLVFQFTERRTGLDATADSLGVGTRAFSGATLAVLLLALASGAYTAKSGAALACLDWPLCHGWTLPQSATLSVWSDPLVRIHMVHRLLAAAAAIMVVLHYAAARHGRFEAPRLFVDARMALVLVVVEVALGAAVVTLAAPLWGALVHQAVGALVFAALALAFLRPFVRRYRFGHA